MLKRLLIILLCPLTVACQQDDEAFIGPELAVATANFAFEQEFEVSDDTADFTSNTIYFSAKFNERVSWTVTVVGSESGAKVDFTGTGTEIDSSILWDGSTNRVASELELFEQEMCTATLHITGLDEVPTTTVYIEETKEYGRLLNDFEADNSLLTPWFGPSLGDEHFFWERTSDFGSPQGDVAVRLYGDDHDNSYFIGSAGYNNVTPIFKGAAIPDPDSLYFNIYVYGEGPESNVKLDIKIEEGDGDDYVMTVVPKHEGWGFFSVKYSDLTIPTGFEVGDNVHSTNNIRLVGFLISSDPSGNAGEIKFDYPIWTIGQPLLNDEAL